MLTRKLLQIYDTMTFVFIQYPYAWYYLISNQISAFQLVFSNFVCNYDHNIKRTPWRVTYFLSFEIMINWFWRWWKHLFKKFGTHIILHSCESIWINNNRNFRYKACGRIKPSSIWARALLYAQYMRVSFYLYMFSTQYSILLKFY